MDNVATERHTHYVDEFRAQEAHLNGWAPDWLVARRRGAIDRFAQAGFPTRRDEAWKYTNLLPFSKNPYPLASLETAVASADWANSVASAVAEDAQRLVFVDGIYAPELSRVSDLPAGVTLEPLRRCFDRDASRLARFFSADAPAATAFTDLGEAFFTDGVYLHVAAGARVSEPLEVLFLGGKGFSAARNVMEIEQGAQVTLIETHMGQGFSALVTDVHTARDARFHHIKIQRDAPAAHHFSDLRAVQDAGSHFGNHFFSFGGQLTRNELRVSIEGEHAHCDLNGLFVTDGDRHVDCHTTLDHKVPNCTSWEMYRGVLADRSSGAFLGKINVFQDAQKTDAKQSCNNLLLSNDAEINAKPCLEIYADDVRCTHGATIGQLDEEALFYLRTRGIDPRHAQQILTHAFAGTVIDALPSEALADRVRLLLTESLRDIEVVS